MVACASLSFAPTGSQPFEVQIAWASAHLQDKSFAAGECIHTSMRGMVVRWDGSQDDSPCPKKARISLCYHGAPVAVWMADVVPAARPGTACLMFSSLSMDALRAWHALLARPESECAGESRTLQVLFGGQPEQAQTISQKGLQTAEPGPESVA